MFALPAFSLTTKLIAAGVVALVVIGAYWAWHTTIYNRGWHAAIAAIAAQDTEAVDAADKARALVRACYDSGGVWSQGSCERRGR